MRKETCPSFCDKMGRIRTYQTFSQNMVAVATVVMLSVANLHKIRFCSETAKFEKMFTVLKLTYLPKKKVCCVK